MKTLREIVYSIIEFVSGFRVTDDNPFDPELIAKKVHDVRAVLIKQEQNAEGGVNDLYYQFHSLEILKNDIPKGQPTGLKRFYVRFPELLTNVGWDNIKYLGKENMAEKYNRRSMDGYTSARGRTWSKDMVDYTVVGNSQALIRNEKTTENIVLIALFANPVEANSLTWDDPYPVPDPFRLEMIIKQDIMAGLGIPPDEKNDAKHNQDEMTQQRK